MIVTSASSRPAPAAAPVVQREVLSRQQIRRDIRTLLSGGTPKRFFEPPPPPPRASTPAPKVPKHAPPQTFVHDSGISSKYLSTEAPTGRCEYPAFRDTEFSRISDRASEEQAAASSAASALRTSSRPTSRTSSRKKAGGTERGVAFSRGVRFPRGKTAMDITMSDLRYNLADTLDGSLTRNVEDSLVGTRMLGDNTTRFTQPASSTQADVGPGSYYHREILRTEEPGSRRRNDARPSSSWSTTERSCLFFDRVPSFHKTPREVDPNQPGEDEVRREEAPLQRPSSAAEQASPLPDTGGAATRPRPATQQSGVRQMSAHATAATPLHRHSSSRSSKRLARPHSSSSPQLDWISSRGSQFGRSARVTLPAVVQSARQERARATREGTRGDCEERVWFARAVRLLEVR